MPGPLTFKERQLCLSGVCPDGNRDGVCAEPGHWVSKDDLWGSADGARQHYGGEPSTRIPMTTAHLMQTAGYNLGHALTHLNAAMDKTGGPKDTKFNMEHAHHHLEEAQDHLTRLVQHIRDHYPKEAAELETVEKAEGYQPADDGGG